MCGARAATAIFGSLGIEAGGRRLASTAPPLAPVGNPGPLPGLQWACRPRHRALFTWAVGLFATVGCKGWHRTFLRRRELKLRRTGSLVRPRPHAAGLTDEPHGRRHRHCRGASPPLHLRPAPPAHTPSPLSPPPPLAATPVPMAPTPAPLLLHRRHSRRSHPEAAAAVS